MPDRLLLYISLGSIAAIFGVDYLLPLSITIPFFYVLPLLLLPSRLPPRFYMIVAITCIWLTIVGAVLDLSPIGDSVPTVAAASNRIFLAVILVVLAWVLGGGRRSESLLSSQATSDALTGLANRRYFFDWLDRERMRLARYPAPVSLAMIDIDHFKKVNDTHGHAVGDQVIKVLAELCRSSPRPADIAARIGGEEFVIAMPATDLKGAMALCERLRSAVAAARVPYPGGTIAFTVSIGVAEAEPGEALADTLARADAALYAAKKAGRNRLSAATKPSLAA